MVRNYKDSWVTEHATQIRTLAAVHRLPPELLAGVAWIEAGGKPYDSKFWVYVGRRYAHSAGLDLEPIKITKNPGETSLGPVAIQLRRAAEAMGLDFATLSGNQKDELVRCLLNANNNLAIVAAHLEQLVKIDFPATRMIGKEEMRIIGARYNRGPQLSLQQIRQNTSYGDVIVDKLYPRLQKLLETSESKAP
jgi:hypothetical protein